MYISLFPSPPSPIMLSRQVRKREGERERELAVSRYVCRYIFIYMSGLAKFSTYPKTTKGQSIITRFLGRIGEDSQVDSGTYLIARYMHNHITDLMSTTPCLLAC